MNKAISVTSDRRYLSKGWTNTCKQSSPEPSVVWKYFFELWIAPARNRTNCLLMCFLFLCYERAIAIDLLQKSQIKEQFWCI